MSSGNRKRRPGFVFKTEKLLLRAVIIGMLVLVSLQFVMLNQSARVFLNYATTLEGGPLEEARMLTNEGSIFIMLENEHLFPQAKLLLNGEPAAIFDKREIQLTVRNNDVLELDASKANDEFIYICIAGISDNVVQPSIGLRIKAKNKIELISRVRLK